MEDSNRQLQPLEMMKEKHAYSPLEPYQIGYWTVSFDDGEERICRVMPSLKEARAFVATHPDYDVGRITCTMEPDKYAEWIALHPQDAGEHLE